MVYLLTQVRRLGKLKDKVADRELFLLDGNYRMHGLCFPGISNFYRWLIFHAAPRSTDRSSRTAIRKQLAPSARNDDLTVRLWLYFLKIVIIIGVLSNEKRVDGINKGYNHCLDHHFDKYDINRHFQLHDSP